MLEPWVTELLMCLPEVGYHVILCDVSLSALEKAMITIDKNLGRMVEKQKLTEQQRHETMNRLVTTSDLPAACVY
ncbi:MAG: 3-hydroxyacyl-CoA dehydrogenase NAD-binding domain-containing protein [Saprospiraceae bacterium]